MIALAAMTVPFCTLNAEDRVPAKLNVILFLVDDMGGMDSTPYGSRYDETPDMQRLAKQSMRYTDNQGHEKVWDFSDVMP